MAHSLSFHNRYSPEWLSGGDSLGQLGFDTAIVERAGLGGVCFN